RPIRPAPACQQYPAGAKAPLLGPHQPPAPQHRLGESAAWLHAMRLRRPSSARPNWRSTTKPCLRRRALVANASAVVPEELRPTDLPNRHEYSFPMPKPSSGPFHADRAQSSALGPRADALPRGHARAVISRVAPARVWRAAAKRVETPTRLRSALRIPTQSKRAHYL